jgi:hypothetical protein
MPASEETTAPPKTPGETPRVGAAAPAPARPPHPPPGLGSLDDALASDVEDLLGGNFETVSAVLGDQAMAPEPVPARARDAAPAHADLGPDLPEGGYSFEPPDCANPEPPATVPAGGEPLPPRGASAAERTDGGAKPARAEPKAAPVDPAPDRPGDATPSGPPPPPSSRLASIWIHAEPLIVDVLETANRPLRRVPPSMRPIVDWIALSLVFWVPIVWVVALFVIG